MCECQSLHAVEQASGHHKMPKLRSLVLLQQTNTNPDVAYQLSITQTLTTLRIQYKTPWLRPNILYKI